MTWLSDLEADLRAKEDRTDALDELLQISFSGDDAERELASWCLAKMAQNKCQDMRVLSILMSMAGISPAVNENVAWGLGELAGVGIGDDSSFAIVKGLMRSDQDSLRATAAWAAGRYRHRMGVSDAESDGLLESMAADPSPLVSMAAGFALRGE